MTTSLDQFLDPAHYHSDAVAAAETAPLATLSTSLLVIRVAIDLRHGRNADATLALKALANSGPVGYQLFQMTTGAMIVAYKTNDKAAFDRALDAWLAGRRQYPGNWINSLLDVPEF
jgi:hypothetical protein